MFYEYVEVHIVVIVPSVFMWLMCVTFAGERSAAQAAGEGGECGCEDGEGGGGCEGGEGGGGRGGG